MNFDDLYQKYKTGELSEEERSFVEGEIEKARRISDLLDSEAAEVPLQDTDAEMVTKAKREFFKKSTRKAILITFSSVLMLSFLLAAVVFGTAIYCAERDASVTQEEAIEIAKHCAAETMKTQQWIVTDADGETETESGPAKIYYAYDALEWIVKDVDQELDMEWNLTESHYVYEVELCCGENTYEIKVNANSGYAQVEDIESAQRARKHGK